MKDNIYLIGFMGTGKSTISKVLKKKMHCQEIDVDAYIVKKQNMEITDIFATYGEEYFRQLETEAFREISLRKDRAVISCGGGAVLREKNVEYMKESGKIVCLTATPETIYARVKNSKDRPVLNGHMNVEYIAQLMEKRLSAYEKASDIQVATDHKTPEAVAVEIMKKV